MAGTLGGTKCGWPSLLRDVDGVVVIEMVSKDIQGPDMAREFIAELMTVVEQGDRKPIVLNLRRAKHFSSMGYAALFKLVKNAKERQRPVRFCSMHDDVRVGGEGVSDLLSAVLVKVDSAALSLQRKIQRLEAAEKSRALAAAAAPAPTAPSSADRARAELARLGVQLP